MKFALAAICTFAFAATAWAEPPRYRFRSHQNQEATTGNPAAEPAPYPPSGSGPYPPSGTKPSGPLFLLPSERQQNLPSPNPPQTYASPSTQAPATTTENADESTTTAARKRPASRGPKSSRLSASDDAENVDTRGSDAQEGAQDPNAVPQGVYYIYHPNGLLQRVVYTTGQDDKGNAFTAQLRYENVEPIRGPIFTYDPNTFQLQPVDVGQLQQQQQQYQQQ